MIIMDNIWPEWQILKEIGRGSSGVVYEAVRHDYGIEAHSAIKVIPIPAEGRDSGQYQLGISDKEKYSWYRELVEDVIREIQLMQDLKGAPNIVSIEDYKVIERTDDFGWDILIRMELLTSLPEWSCNNDYTEKDVANLGKDICRALEICGKKGILHRDIKPENIFIDSLGNFKLGDFGVSKKLEVLTGDMTLVGTTNYMAPEVYMGETYDQTADLYSLGIVLYRMLNRNRLPFLPEKQILSSSDRSEAFRKRMQGDVLPPPCDASPRMAAVIQKACAFKADNRYQSAAEFQAALDSIDNTPSEPRKRPKWMIIVPILVAVTIIAFVFDILIPARPEPTTPPPPTVSSSYLPEVDQPAEPDTGGDIDHAVESVVEEEAEMESETGQEENNVPDTPHPSEEDLKGSTEKLVHPDVMNWLQEYETQYVKTKYGNLAYLRYAPEEDSDHYDTVTEREMVTVLARQNGFTLVLTERGIAGWVTSKVLVNQYDS